MSVLLYWRRLVLLGGYGMKKFIVAGIFMVLCTGLQAQSMDTTSIYKDRKDSLSAAVFVGHQENSISRGKTLRTELISASGLQKMACCNLAESFENSASVTVGYSDAVTGARQIRLLGLSGTYTQMLDENRPVMRGITAPYGLSYVPGPWLESIQIAKGSPSVINGLESMTGQINLEHKKPTEEKPLFIQASMMSDTKADFNATSAWRLSPTIYTILLGHVSGNFKTYDMNHDGFRDDPRMLQFNVANRWLYYTPELQVRWGVKAVRDRRQGGMDGYDKDRLHSLVTEPVEVTAPARGSVVRQDSPTAEVTSIKESLSGTPWGTDITNSLLNAYLKVGKPLREDGSSSIAAIADWSWQKSDSWFGASSYLASQQSGFVNLLYRNMLNESHDFTVGLSGTFDHIDEAVSKLDYSLWNMTDGNILRPYSGIADHFFGGAYGEYTFHAGDIFTSIVGVSADWYKGNGLKVAPRVTLKYSPAEWLVARANGGRGLRYADPVADNIGVMSTHSWLKGDCMERLLEDSWTFGGNVTFYLPFGVDPSKTYISFDYFRTQFVRQSMVDYEVPGVDVNGGREIWFFDSDGRRSYSDNWQVDFNVEPFDRFTVALTGRYTNARQENYGGELVEKPMLSRFKGVLNLQYKTNLSRWIFDFTASVNGSARVYDFMKDLRDGDGSLLYADGRTPVYPLLYAQITRRFRGFDIYAGVENITDFTQKHVLVGDRNAAGERSPWTSGFDASCVWGPIMGRRINLGVRLTLWRATKND